MILWTVMPLDLVLDGAEKMPACEEIDYGGLKIMVEKTSPVECRIVRLLSTNPQDFLRPDIQPGQVLAYRPVYEAR
ncbi:MAG TPA: YlzJ-like family protein [Selenomonadales bacterium]|nr:YlzJ-like family protein [Selenomonadales bacterium]